MAGAVRAGTCEEAALDGDVAWSGLKHDSFDPAWRTPFGAVPAGEGTVTLRLRTCRDDVTDVRLRLWDDVADVAEHLAMTHMEDDEDAELGPVSYWELELEIPAEPTRLFYYFAVQDGGATAWYQDDDTALYGGGTGEPTGTEDTGQSWQITVYDGEARWSDRLEGAVVYQVLPDRFRNGDPDNDPTRDPESEDYYYGETPLLLDWTDDLAADADPQCTGDDTERAVCFYGGDLQGVLDELDYLESLGVDLLYLNPIFTAPTNHRYDPQDLFSIDPDLGDLDLFQELVEACEARGIGIMLDGVFNHMSADSAWFDHYSRFDAELTRTGAEPGTNDGSGACESESSPYRDWFYFDPEENVARYNDGTVAWCPHGDDGGSTYQGWAGYYHIPKLNAEIQGVRDLVFDAGSDSAAVYWLDQGAAGWRLDVPNEMDGGLGDENDLPFWEDFRAALREVDPDAAIVGEYWGDASRGLAGDEWDGVMNYRFSSALLDWVFDECSGDGCAPCTELNCEGDAFSDSEHHSGRQMGEINAIGEGLLNARLLSILEDYPPPVWTRAWNLLGSHDTNRILFLLRKISGEDEELARRKLEFLALFQYTWPGAPTLYYGDEVGLDPDAGWDGSTWKADPYNRAPYPWEDEGLDPDEELLDHYQSLASLRERCPVLDTGTVEVVHYDDDARVFSFLRYDEDDERDPALAIFNRSWEGDEAASTVAIPVPEAVAHVLAEGSCWEDALAGTQATVRNGTLAVADIPHLGAAVMVPSAEPCSDTDPPEETGEPDQDPADETDPTDTSEPETTSRECGCTGTPTLAAPGLAMLAALAGARRRRADSSG